MILLKCENTGLRWMGKLTEEIGTLCRINWIFVFIVRGFGVWVLKENYCKKTEPWDFLSGPVVKTLWLHCRRLGFDPLLGNQDPGSVMVWPKKKANKKQIEEEGRASFSDSRSVVSDSLPHHGLKAVRLLCAWNFLGKNTGVSCHFLLQGIFLTQGLNFVCYVFSVGRRVLYQCATWDSLLLVLNQCMWLLKLFISINEGMGTVFSLEALHGESLINGVHYLRK